MKLKGIYNTQLSNLYSNLKKKNLNKKQEKKNEAI